MAMRFIWDEAKNRSNQRKHDGISFELALGVFRDPNHVTVLDQVVAGEERWQTVGVVRGITILLVVHTWTVEDEGQGLVEMVRIISARRATAMERRRYGDDDR